jgi:hypothetical protein
VTLFVVDLLPLFRRIRARMDDQSLLRAEAHFGRIATVRSSLHLQGVVRATDSAITHVHGLPLTAPPTPAWEELTTNNYKIPTTNNVANDLNPGSSTLCRISSSIATLMMSARSSIRSAANRTAIERTARPRSSKLFTRRYFRMTGACLTRHTRLWFRGRSTFLDRGRMCSTTMRGTLRRAMK